jgi:hypothetical protein
MQEKTWRLLHLLTAAAVQALCKVFGRNGLISSTGIIGGARRVRATLRACPRPIPLRADEVTGDQSAGTKAMGHEIPAGLVLRADKVIE